MGDIIYPVVVWNLFQTRSAVFNEEWFCDGFVNYQK